MEAPLEPRVVLDDHEVDDRTRVIAVGGELHMATAPQLAAHLTRAVRGGSDRVLVDLSEVQFIDSTGLGVLLVALRDLRRVDGRMVIVATNPTVLRLFAITGTDGTLPIVGSREEGLQTLRRTDG